MRQKKKKEVEKFLTEFKKYEDQGVKFMMKGRETSLDKIARICAVKERGSYMGDFISDSAGDVVEIHFDRIEDD